MLRFEPLPNVSPSEPASAGAQAAPPASGFSAAQAFSVALRYKLLISTCMLLGVGGAFGLSKVLTPRYISTSELYIDPQSLQILDKPLTSQADGGPAAIDMVESQARVITSQSVLRRVVEREHLTDDPYFTGTGPGDKLTSAVDTLALKVTVKRPERTFVASISVTTDEAEKSARIANTLAQSYIDQHADSFAKAAQKTSASLSAQLDSLRAQTQKDQQAVEDFKQEHDLVGTRRDLVSEEQLTGVSTELVAARSRTAAAQARFDQIQIARRTNDASALSENLKSQTISALRGQQAEAKRKLAELGADLGPMHPQVRQAEMTVRDINRSIEEETSRIISSAKTDLDRAKQNEVSLGKSLQTMKGQSSNVSAALAQLKQLEAEAASSQTLYQNVLQRARETGGLGKFDPSNTRIISTATASSARSFPPKTPVLLAAGGMAGLVLGFLAAFGIDLLRRKPAAVKAARIEPEVIAVKAPEAVDTEAAKWPAKAAEPVAPVNNNRALILETWGGAEPIDPALDVLPVYDSAPRRKPEVRVEKPREAASLAVDLRKIDLPILSHRGNPQLMASTSELWEMLEIASAADSGEVYVLAGNNEGDARSIAAVNVALEAAQAGLRILLVETEAESSSLKRSIGKARPDWGNYVEINGILPTENGVDLMLDVRDSQQQLPRLRRALRLSADYDVVIFDGFLKGSEAATLMAEAADRVVLVQSIGANPAFARRGVEAALGQEQHKFCGIVEFAGMDAATEMRKAG